MSFLLLLLIFLILFIFLMFKHFNKGTFFLIIYSIVIFIIVGILILNFLNIYYPSMFQ